MRSGPEIQAALRRFVGAWRGYEGTERAEAQTYLNQLFECYGSDRKAVGARFEDFRSSAGFMDLHWPSVCIVEMKAPTRAATLGNAREQVMRYWQESSDPAEERPAARWVVLCAFTQFEIWEPGRFPSQPRLSFDLDELPERYEALQFLAGSAQEPVFIDHYRELTREATGTIAALYQALKDRSAAPLDEIQRFTLQSVWTLFAEDLGMLQGYPFQMLVDALKRDSSRSSAAELGHLFRVLNQKGNHNRVGLLAGTRYVNGDLFGKPAEVHLKPSELEFLAEAASHDWRKVNPTIFGSLMEGVLGAERRWELGAHYTHEADILKIVVPTVVRPWRERIEATRTPQQARDVLDELCRFRVLDPACGCGNFLYVAYRELRALEYQLKERIRDLAEESGQPVPTGLWPYYPLSNLRGIDIERVAVLISRVTLWMGHRQMIEAYGEAENPLPLVDLSSIQVADALRISWPETDCVIGNPPFLGSQHIRGARGDEYVGWLERHFGVGIKDYCVYWFRRTHEHLLPGQRAGLVGTNSVSQNRARSVSLDYITSEGGVITEAVSSQKWPGEAKVHVSLVNWVKKPGSELLSAVLDGSVVPGINSSLRVTSLDAWTAVPLPQNAKRCFQGPIPVGAGFIIPAGEAQDLLARDDADYSEVVRPYLVGEDIADDPEQSPSRWTIDFALRTLEQARRYPAALDIVRERVRPVRDSNNRKIYRDRWWLFGEPRVGLRAATASSTRYVAGLATGKRLHLAWQDSWTCPSNLTYVFAFDDDYSMGVLQSRAHVAWAWAQCSTFKGDLRYTPTSAFHTFAWPYPVTDAQRVRVGEVCRRMLARRSEICRAERIGLTTLYNRMDDGAYADLKVLQHELDQAVVACYGWPKPVAQDDPELVWRLTMLNREIADGARRYDPFGSVAARCR